MTLTYKEQRLATRIQHQLKNSYDYYRSDDRMPFSEPKKILPIKYLGKNKYWCEFKKHGKTIGLGSITNIQKKPAKTKNMNKFLTKVLNTT